MNGRHTDAEKRRLRWEPALRSWHGARDGLDSAVARYTGGDPTISAAVSAQHVREALARATEALAELHLVLEREARRGATSTERAAWGAALVQDYAAILEQVGQRTAPRGSLPAPWGTPGF